MIKTFLNFIRQLFKALHRTKTPEEISRIDDQDLRAPFAEETRPFYVPPEPPEFPQPPAPPLTNKKIPPELKQTTPRPPQKKAKRPKHIKPEISEAQEVKEIQEISEKSEIPEEPEIREIPEETEIPEPKRTKYDKKGFRILNNRDNLEKLFSGDKHRDPNSNSKNKKEENFKELFENSHEDFHQKMLFHEKKHSETKGNVLTIREQIKNYPKPESELDLHGLNGTEAETVTLQFIRVCQNEGIRTIRIIVGKGLHSSGKAVLPDLIEKLLLRLKREKHVLSHHWEKKIKEKSGAVIVYLIGYRHKHS